MIHSSRKIPLTITLALIRSGRSHQGFGCGIRVSMVRVRASFRSKAFEGLTGFCRPQASHLVLSTCSPGTTDYSQGLGQSWNFVISVRVRVDFKFGLGFGGGEELF